MNKLNKILLAVVVVLLLVLALIMWKPDFFKQASFYKPSYYAVYMTSGDLYFGQMCWWRPHVLKDARMIQREQASENEQPKLNLVKLSDAIWGPIGDLKLNEKSVMWRSKLGDSSQVVQLFNAQ